MPEQTKSMVRHLVEAIMEKNPLARTPTHKGPSQGPLSGTDSRLRRNRRRIGPLSYPSSMGSEAPSMRPERSLARTAT